MKYLIAVFLITFIFANGIAQIKKLPKEIKQKDWTINSRTTGHKGYEAIKVAIAISNTEGKGETLSFTSNTLINKVEFSFVGTKMPKSSYINEQGTKNYQFYLQSGAYMGGQKNGYLLYFYTKGFDKPIWVVLLSKK